MAGLYITTLGLAAVPSLQTSTGFTLNCTKHLQIHAYFKDFKVAH